MGITHHPLLISKYKGVRTFLPPQCISVMAGDLAIYRDASILPQNNNLVKLQVKQSSLMRMFVQFLIYKRVGFFVLLAANVLKL